MGTLHRRRTVGQGDEGGVTLNSSEGKTIDLVQSHWAIVDLQNEHVHFGRIRFVGDLLILHEDDAGRCCREQVGGPCVVVLPRSEIASITILPDESSLDEAVRKLGLHLSKTSTSGPEVG